MSLYFEGFLALDLKPNIPQQVIETLQYMARVEDYVFANMPDHDFFKIDGWRQFFQEGLNWGDAPGAFGFHFSRAYRYRGCINKLLDRQRVSTAQISEQTFRSLMKIAANANEFIHT